VGGGGGGDNAPVPVLHTPKGSGPPPGDAMDPA
jgi:hypothetical protein